MWKYLAIIFKCNIGEAFPRPVNLMTDNGQPAEHSHWIWETVVFVAASHQTRLDTRSKARRPIKVGIKGRGRSGRSRDSNPCLSVLLIGSLSAMWAWWGKQFHEPKCGSEHVFFFLSFTTFPVRAPIRHECQTALLKSRGETVTVFFFILYYISLA